MPGKLRVSAVLLVLFGIFIGLSGSCAAPKEDEAVVLAKLSDAQVSYERGTPENALRVMDSVISFIDQQKPNPRLKSHLSFARVITFVRKAIIQTSIVIDPEGATASKADAIKAIKEAITEKVFPLKVAPDARDDQLFDAVAEYIETLDAEPLSRWRSKK